MTTTALCLFLGFLLSKVLPTGKTAPVYKPLTEADFQRILVKRGLR